MKTSAIISSCSNYRYALWRRWSHGPQILFVMLNPSTADATTDDPTIRRCIGFAKAWGFGSLAVGNLFSFRTASPRILRLSAEPIGESNDLWLRKLKAESTMAIAAWGNHGTLHMRGHAVRSQLGELHTLGLTKIGQPRHPLYVAANTTPCTWNQALHL
jgi:hypothetical protein